MRWLRLIWSLLAVLAVATACGPALVESVTVSADAEPIARIQARLHVRDFRVQVAARSVADVSSVFELMNGAGGALSATTAQAVTCDHPADGHLCPAGLSSNAGNVSVTQGGATLSSSTVSVNGGAVTYSSGSA
jgi:hypothetical protein